MRPALIALAVLTMLVWTLSADDPWKAPAAAASLKNPLNIDSRTLREGKELFKANCLPCHGETGKGDGPMGAMLEERPRDLTNSKVMDQKTDGEIFWKISTGRDPMPSFKKKGLTQKERWTLVAYVRSLAKK
ncbi:MAG: cytochrome c [Acidobacteria bacterium]|nr:cytochrome c [Acidobacteriota bacterium]